MSGSLRKKRNKIRAMRGKKAKLIRAIATGTQKQIDTLVSHKGKNYLSNFKVKNHSKITKMLKQTYDIL